MRYCKFCGRQLGDGELCSCPEAMDEVLVPWDMVRRASRIHIFRQPQKPGKQPARKAAKAAPQGDAPKKGKGKSGKSKHPGRNEAEDI